jgi:hypothetical protein
MLCSLEVGWFAVFMSGKWIMIFFRSIDHCILCWHFCGGYWMLRDIDDMEATCDYLVKDGTSDPQTQCKICVLTITNLGIVILNIEYDFVYSIRCQQYPWDLLREPSPDVHSIAELPVYISQTLDFSYILQLYLPDLKHTTSDQLTEIHTTIWNPCSLLPQAAAFGSSWRYKLAVTHSLLNWR